MIVPAWLAVACLIGTIFTPILILVGLLRIQALEGRVLALENRADEPPSRIDLSKDIGKVAERVRGLETTVEALRRIGETTNQYLNMLIEQGLHK
jgi:hypothetical protein